MTLDDFLTLPLPQRIIWLHGSDGPRGRLSHDRFADALGTTRQIVIGWEKGREPSADYAAKLAQFSGFPAWAFRRRESEAAVFESFARRLQELEAQQVELRDLVLQAIDVIHALEAEGPEDAAVDIQSQPRQARSG